MLTTFLTHGGSIKFKRFWHLMPTTVLNRGTMDRLFQCSLQTCNTEKVEFILSTGYTPMEIYDPRPLRYCPNVLNRLLDLLPPHVLMRQDIVSVAMESNNLVFLQATESHFDARRNMPTRDLIVSARKGALDALKWFHATCPCSNTNYAKCILDECIYNAGMQSRQSNVIEWLQNDTNCNLRRMGYPRLGWFGGFGYGDLYDGSRGFVWFLR